ncbi:B12-binding domain-containing radical SAM protein [Magnetococcales bacterium HHB-1]
MSDTTTIWMSDFFHKSNTFRTFPLGIGYVASYTKKMLPTACYFRLFKSPETFMKAFRQTTNPPHVVGLSHMIWNQRLSYAVVEQIKRIAPGTVIVMGGANYPNEPQRQQAFFQKHPLVDFHIQGEGEKAFFALIEKLIQFNFDVKALKDSNTRIDGCHYLYNNALITGGWPKRLATLDDIPSPYLSGLLDEFFPQHLSPVMQFERGCPFSCTYCNQGHDYFNNVRHHSLERFEAELRYIAERIPDKEITLHFSDSNFGMFAADVDACTIVGRIQKELGWPLRIDTSLGKNRVDRILKGVSQLNYGTVWYSAALQSADDEVLQSIKRKNIATEKLLETSKKSTQYNRGSNSEIILNLPGDSKKAHLHTLRTVMEANISRIRMYTLLLLPGSEAETIKDREKFGLKTKYRVLPRNFGYYTLDSKKEVALVEISEIPVESDTMPYEDYLYCRLFDLSVELFYNDRYFNEVRGLLNHLGLSIFDFVQRCHDQLDQFPDNLKALYDGLKESVSEELWDSGDALLAYMAQGDHLKKYAQIEHQNSLATLRAIGILECADGIHTIAKKAVYDLVRDKGALDETMTSYIDELFLFCLHRKQDLLKTNYQQEVSFRFNFSTLSEIHFQGNPLTHALPKKQTLRFWHEPNVGQEMTRLYKKGKNHVLGLRNVLFYSIAANPGDYYFRSFEPIP